MGYRITKEKLTGVDVEILQRFANTMTYVEFIEFIKDKTDERLKTMIDDARDDAFYAQQVQELLKYRMKALDTFEKDLQELREE